MNGEMETERLLVPLPLPLLLATADEFLDVDNDLYNDRDFIAETAWNPCSEAILAMERHA